MSSPTCAWEIWGNIVRYGELALELAHVRLGDMGRCSEIWGDIVRYVELALELAHVRLGDMGRYSEI